jgi:hypothetical protein
MNHGEFTGSGEFNLTKVVARLQNKAMAACFIKTVMLNYVWFFAQCYQ